MEDQGKDNEWDGWTMKRALDARRVSVEQGRVVLHIRNEGSVAVNA